MLRNGVIGKEACFGIFCRIFSHPVLTLAFIDAVIVEHLPKSSTALFI
ncbi:hypothetical protein CLV99_0234 [Sphingobacterium yanglingense]|uniref:Uncharacterized protein n=1 Tax=Sphingobacterium yanglingense TaxID=1437280 RepID=A0A4R6WS04_9SPHI|nr:hypothetical protein CLV99_0234 [Sphingobacterium yanglingense]